MGMNRSRLLGVLVAMVALVGGLTVITDLVLQPGWPAAGPTGLGVEFGLPNLNNSALAGHTAVYATISYFDSNSRRTQRFRTGTLNGYFGA